MIYNPAMDPKSISKNGQPWQGNSSNTEASFRKQSDSNGLSKFRNDRQKYGPTRSRNLDQRYTNRAHEYTENKRNYSEVKSLRGNGNSQGKKQKEININHLANFTYTSRDDQLAGGEDLSRPRSGRVRTISKSSNRPSYNKEHYLQANCQFVVSSGPSYEIHATDPDTLVDWENIEQIRTTGHELPNCPICLYPPVVAKITRCGHVYCWTCILHYLALSDKNWRKCPICYESVHKYDLRSVSSTAYTQYKAGDVIEMKLMRRDRRSLIPLPVETIIGYSFPPNFQDNIATSMYSKLLVADSKQVIDLIIKPERETLVLQLMQEKGTPEACFIKDALELTEKREEGVRLKANTLLSDVKITPEAEEAVTSTVVSKTFQPVNYISAFDDSCTLSDDCLLDQKSHQKKTDKDERSCKVGLESNVSHTSTKPKDHFYFYQAGDGQHIYMHSLNVRMLMSQYGSLEFCPPVISAKIVEIQPQTMHDELRHKLRYLAHLPVTCHFDVAELMLKEPFISHQVYIEYKEEIDKRKKKRNRKAVFEKRHEKRVLLNEKRTLDSLAGMMCRTEIPCNDSRDELDDFLGMPVQSESKPCSSQYTGPSFAQMLQSGKNKVDIPVLDKKPHGEAIITNVPNVRLDPDSEPEPVDWVPPPTWENFVGDAISAALDNMQTGQKKKGKKGKRSSVVLFASGGGCPQL